MPPITGTTLTYPIVVGIVETWRRFWQDGVTRPQVKEEVAGQMEPRGAGEMEKVQ